MEEIKVFLDSNVVFSSLLSTKGASFQILKNNKIIKIISRTIKNEVLEVAKRHNIDLSNKKIFAGLKIISLHLKKDKVNKLYSSYVSDLEDSHVVAGAHKSKSKFLLTHNIKHYQIAKIQNDLGIIVIKPGLFLQYLRSR